MYSLCSLPIEILALLLTKYNIKTSLIITKDMLKKFNQVSSINISKKKIIIKDNSIEKPYNFQINFDNKALKLLCKNKNFEYELKFTIKCVYNVNIYCRVDFINSKLELIKNTYYLTDMDYIVINYYYNLDHHYIIVPIMYGNCSSFLEIYYDIIECEHIIFRRDIYVNREHTSFIEEIITSVLNEKFDEGVILNFEEKFLTGTKYNYQELFDTFFIESK